MSLLYIIDGYNITNHPLFAKLSNRKLKDSKEALLDLIAHRALGGSPKNKITVVFDGREHYGNSGIVRESSHAKVIFSGEESADDRIIKIAQGSDPPNTVVVSDDKQVRMLARSTGCNILSVEQFIDYRQKAKYKDMALDPELNYTQKEKINQELRKLWLE